LTICEKDSDSSGEGDRENHDSIRASQSQNQACIQNSQNDDALIFVGGTEEISDVDNLLVILDDKSDSDSESEDDFGWKKRRVDQVSWLEAIDETNNEANDTKFSISCTRGRAGNAKSESDSSTFTDLVERQPAARVEVNGEWGIHGIIGKEVIEGVLHYCVDWEPTMLLKDALRGAWRMVQKFEAKEQARGKRGDSRKRK
ncbi:MAG: hypothetical protein M1839_005776, partial [Geoglossum umbratile]